MILNLHLKLAILSASNIVAGFLLQWYALVQLGAGRETDALLIGFTLPQLVSAVLSVSVLQVLVPILSGEPEGQFDNDFWSFFIVIGAVFAVLACGFYALAPVWVPLIAPGLSESSITLTIGLSRVQLLTMVITGLVVVQSAAHQAREGFLWIEASNLIAALLSLCMLVWALPRFGVVAAAWAAVFRVLLQLFLMMPGLGAFRVPELKRSSIKLAWTRVSPMLLGALYFKSDLVLDRLLLSLAPSGTISLFNLGQQVYGACSQVLNRAIAAPMSPVLSVFHKQGDAHGFRAHFQRWHAVVLIFTLLVLLVGWAAAKPLFTLLIGYGKISHSDIGALMLIMVGLGGVFIGGSAGQITSGAFYARGDTLTPTRLGIVTFTVYVPVKIALFCYFGIVGLAVGTSLFFLANWLLQWAYLNKLLASDGATPK